MPTHLKQDEVGQVYFCTVTCYRWLQLINEADAFDAVYNWFSHLQQKDCCIVTGYVIMPNHLHILLHYKNEKRTLNKIVGEGKRFMAYDIVNRLKQCMKYELLEVLSAGVAPKEGANGKKHQVFISSFDAKPCFTQKMIEQKLDYIHRNPVSGRWNLVDDYVKYEHSSACFYNTGVHKNFEVTHYKEL